MPIDPLALAPYRSGRLLEVSKVAHRLDTNPRFVWRQIHEGHLPALRLGTRWRVDEADLEAYIAARKAAHKRPGEDRSGTDRRHEPAIILQHPRDRTGG